ncbi:MAG: hypothetical protein F7C35_03200 [Desulfurococcales archaeon]|nr:hypothetical protein [Desulfurococcales archaeon]
MRGDLELIGEGFGGVSKNAGKALVSGQPVPIDNVNLPTVLGYIGACSSKMILTLIPEAETVMVTTRAFGRKGLVERLKVHVLVAPEGLGEERVKEALSNCPFMSLLLDKVDEISVSGVKGLEERSCR